MKVVEKLSEVLHSKVLLFYGLLSNVGLREVGAYGKNDEIVTTFTIFSWICLGTIEFEGQGKGEDGTGNLEV